MSGVSNGHNRKTAIAHPALLGLSKTTLADLVWDLAATHPECASCDELTEVLRVIVNSMRGPQVKAPVRELRMLAAGLEKTLGPIPLVQLDKNHSA
jgi:hypothetical protein